MTIDQFESYRPLLFSIAYRMMGTVADAEDILQDAWLRVQEQVAETIERPKQYLSTVVTRLCLNQLNSARIRREQYLGPWLPEPVPTADHPQIINPLEKAIVHDSISIAFLVVLESLQPAERAVFLLHEVFDYKHAEIGLMLEKSEAACRQLLRRARQRIAENRPRYHSSPIQHEQFLHHFVQVVEVGELDAFLQLLANDVTLVPDGGGERGAAIRILRGRDAVAAFALGTYKKSPVGIRYTTVVLNGQPAIVAYTQSGQPYFALFLYGDNGVVKLIHAIAGRKLTALREYGVVCSTD